MSDKKQFKNQQKKEREEDRQNIDIPQQNYQQEQRNDADYQWCPLDLKDLPLDFLQLDENGELVMPEHSKGLIDPSYIDGFQFTDVTDFKIMDGKEMYFCKTSAIINYNRVPGNSQLKQMLDDLRQVVDKNENENENQDSSKFEKANSDSIPMPTIQDQTDQTSNSDLYQMPSIELGKYKFKIFIQKDLKPKFQQLRLNYFKKLALQKQLDLHIIEMKKLEKLLNTIEQKKLKKN